jgi:hypothetical protein
MGFQQRPDSLPRDLVIIRNKDSKSTQSSTPSEQTTKLTGRFDQKHFVCKIVALSRVSGCKEIAENPNLFIKMKLSGGNALDQVFTVVLMLL